MYKTRMQAYVSTLQQHTERASLPHMDLREQKKRVKSAQAEKNNRKLATTY